MKLWHRIRSWIWPGWFFVRGTAFRRPKHGYFILTPEDRVCSYPTKTVLDVLEGRGEA